ncbi:MAG: ribosome biogenesis GTP-binding protein YihA/YsxC [Flavobacteriaceae bacterium]|nr:ribosome biogenesis GTP-binding protein YihA/YsxC [Flavobacteriaceae bacterium]MCY4268188.1 ribosome biogenesis GTP-binding protein YihA/YsxC [Flavobacteriaceae bacterium]MCY4300097.1 ribosome biogenesis GTP-binding protein YihA/YsxC [Flavobacteriaceae bacterium]
MVIQSAEFISSSTHPASCPGSRFFEYAFIGRSNVGKSRLINALCHRKNLAITSSTPGKTRFINHFLINKSWYLVDLPGYGYARTSKHNRKILSERIKQYLVQRRQLILTFVLIDIRIIPQVIDITFLKWMHTKNLPFIIVFTKADALKSKKLNSQIGNYQNTLAEIWEPIPQSIVSSSISKVGLDDILDVISNLNHQFKCVNG